MFGSGAQSRMHTDNVASFHDLEILIAIRCCTQQPVINHLTYAKLSAQYKSFTIKIKSVDIPRYIQSVLQDPYWKMAVLEEINALTGNDTWEIVDFPKDRRAVGHKRILH